MYVFGLLLIVSVISISISSRHCKWHHSHPHHRYHRHQQLVVPLPASSEPPLASITVIVIINISITNIIIIRSRFGSSKARLPLAIHSVPPSTGLAMASFSYGDGFQIYVKTLRLGTITLDVNDSDTIDNVAKRCRRKTDSMVDGDIEVMPGTERTFIFEGQHLEDDTTLADTSIQPESTLRCGGASAFFFLRYCHWFATAFHSSYCDFIFVPFHCVSILMLLFLYRGCDLIVFMFYAI